VKRQYLIIAADFWADLGKRFVSLTLFDLLIFKEGNCLSNLLWMSAVEQAPSILLSPFAGLLVDRIGSGRLLAGALICKCVLAAALVFSVLPKAVITIYLLFICASLFFTMGRLTIIPLLVSRNLLIPFNALNERVAIAGAVASPFIVGWTITQIGKRAALGMAGLLFLIAICAVVMLPKNVAVPGSKTIPNPEPQDRRNWFSAHRVIFKNNQNLGIYFIMLGFVLLGGGILNFSLPLLFKDRFGGDISQWGFLMSLYQAGAFLSTLLLRCSVALSLRRALIVCFFTLSAAMAVLGKFTPPFKLSWLMILFGCGFTFIHVLFESLIQKNSPDPHAGKIVSVLLTLRGVCYLGATLGSALVLKLLDTGSLLLVGALLLLVASTLVKASSFARHSNFHLKKLP
jgi:MFS transporter, ACDE family, multidrug resistance protein